MGPAVSLKGAVNVPDLILKSNSLTKSQNRDRIPDKSEESQS